MNGYGGPAVGVTSDGLNGARFPGSKGVIS